MEEVPAELLEEASPHADIHLLFQHYNSVYFDNTLGATRVEWSSGRMTRRDPDRPTKEWGDCVIRLSKPILVLRPEEDLKNTLLHEMIHAYIMLHRIPGAGKDGHGPPFKDKMAVINSAQVPDIHRPQAGYNVTVYHTMIDEVRHYQQHWWQCQSCSMIKRRAMNRRPQPADCLTRQGDSCQHPKCSYHVHERTCGGEYIKIKEPEPKPKAPRKSKAASKPVAANHTIAAAFAQVKAESSTSELVTGNGPSGSSAVAMAALAGSIRRRPGTANAQPLIAQFAQMAPRNPAAARGTGAALVDLTSDASDGEPEPAAAPPAMPPPATAQLRGSNGAQPQHDASTVHNLASPHRSENDVQRERRGARAAAGGERGGGASGRSHGDAQASGTGKARAGRDGESADAERLLKRQRVGDTGAGAAHATVGAAAAGQVSSDGAGVVVLDDDGVAEVAGDSPEDVERRRRRALCAAAAERRHARAAASEEAHEPDEQYSAL